VLQKGAQSRDVYLPDGKWRDIAAGTVVEGRRWLRGYHAPLSVLPVFVRVGSSAESAAAPTGAKSGVSAPSKR
jgi:alpha-glucosidase (family GH31 glycosyl hydrolase)